MPAILRVGEGREIIFWGLKSWLASSKGKMERSAIGGGHALYFQEGSLEGLLLAFTAT